VRKTALALPKGRESIGEKFNELLVKREDISPVAGTARNWAMEARGWGKHRKRDLPKGETTDTVGSSTWVRVRPIGARKDSGGAGRLRNGALQPREPHGR